MADFLCAVGITLTLLGSFLAPTPVFPQNPISDSDSLPSWQGNNSDTILRLYFESVSAPSLIHDDPVWHESAADECGGNDGSAENEVPYATAVNYNEINSEYTWVYEIADSYGLSGNIVCGLIETESQWNPDALGACGDSGLMQIVPVYHQQEYEELGCISWFDPESNVKLGCYILSYCLEYCDGDMYRALQMYNTGSPDVINGYADKVLSNAEHY